MHFEATNTFKRFYKKLDKEVREQVKKTLNCFKGNPYHPSLGNKKITGQKNIYEIRVSRNIRITYSKIGDTAVLRKVGTHDILSNP